MKTTQAWAWLAAGVLALGLNGFYQDGGAAWAHRIAERVGGTVADRSSNLLAIASDQVDRALERVSLVASREKSPACRLAPKVASLQYPFVRTEEVQFDEMTAREERQLARLEAGRARMQAQLARVRAEPVAFNIPNIQIACPRVRVSVPRVRIPQVSIPAVPRVRVEVPAVKVEMGEGPI
jgi:hypothetical protein